MTIEEKTTFDLSQWLANPNWQDEVMKAVETKKYLKISDDKLEVTYKTEEQAAPEKLFAFIEKYIPTLNELKLCDEITKLADLQAEKIKKQLLEEENKKIRLEVQQVLTSDIPPDLIATVLSYCD